MGSPYTIDLVAYFWSLDPEEEEAKLHRLFDEHRIRGEWFNPAPHLLELIKHHAGSVMRALAG